MLNQQGGELVAVLRGANAPQLQRMIVEELAKEKLVLEQGTERRVVSHTITYSYPFAQYVHCLYFLFHSNECIC